MESNDLQGLILSSIKKGTVFINPKRGTSTVSTITPDYISYIRGKSRIYLPMYDILQVYDIFSGQRCTTQQLREYNPSVFDSTKNGHSCNCTFLFSLFDALGLAKNGIYGSGKRGDPYYINLI